MKVSEAEALSSPWLLHPVSPAAGHDEGTAVGECCIDEGSNKGGSAKPLYLKKPTAASLLLYLCCQLLRQFREISSLVLNLVKVERGA